MKKYTSDPSNWDGKLFFKSLIKPSIFFVCNFLVPNMKIILNTKLFEIIKCVWVGIARISHSFNVIF